MIQQVAILGCGLIGSSWATFFSSQGFRTKLYDINPEISQRGTVQAENNLQKLVELETLPEEKLEEAISNLLPVHSLEELLGDCDYVQESVLEDYDVKAELYREMESYLSNRAIIASSSSGLLMTRMQQVLKHPQRSLIAHPFNPPHLIPLVELVPGKQTSRETIETVRDFFLQLGKQPVLLKKEVPGHIANRLAAALWREALSLLDDDVASLEDIDTALCSGPGLRWALMGQHLIYELGGGVGGYNHFIETIGSSFSTYWEDMQTWSQIPESAKKKAIEGTSPLFEKRTREEWLAWRDEKLVKIQKILEE